MNLLDRAIAESIRWPVFPLNADKRPTCANGFKDASQDPAVLADLFSHPDAALIGAPTGEVSGLDVLDIDPGAGGFDWLDGHMHLLPETEVQYTRKPGGMHYLFAHHPGMRSSASKIARGVDVRADGGYIVRWSATGNRVDHAGVLAPWPDFLIIQAQRSRLLSTGAGALKPEDLAPPSVAVLVDLLERLPNPESATRDDYLQICLSVQGCIRGLEATGGCEDPEPIVHAAAEWAARWGGPSPGSYIAEREKWESDWSHRDSDLAGWRNLLALATRLGHDTGEVRHAQAVAEFAVAPLAVAEHWYDRLQFARGGEALPNLANALLVFRDDPAWRGVLAYDEMQRTVMVLRPVPCEGSRPPGGPFPRPITDLDVTYAQEWLQLAGIRQVSAATVAMALSAQAAADAQHPVRNYLSGLAWDGTPRVSGWLTRYIGAADDEVSRQVGRMFLIAMVARIMRPGCKSDYMLILEGAQGALKSTACAILGGGWFSDSMPGNTAEKDAAQHLRGKWLIEMGELHALSRSDTTALKAFVTRQEERYRPSYGRHEVVEPRQCIFIGTTNQCAYLNDETGGRRFWPIKVGAVDTGALARDRDQLFAEAVAMFQAGEKWWPDRDFEQQHLRPAQEARFDADAWEGAVGEFLGGQERITVLDVARLALRLETAKVGTVEQRRISRIMERLGWHRKPSNGVRWWRPNSVAVAQVPHLYGDSLEPVLVVEGDIYTTESQYIASMGKGVTCATATLPAVTNPGFSTLIDGP